MSRSWHAYACREKHLCMACQGDNVEVKPTGTSICAKIVWPFNIKACEVSDAPIADVSAASC